MATEEKKKVEEKKKDHYVLNAMVLDTKEE